VVARPPQQALLPLLLLRVVPLHPLREVEAEMAQELGVAAPGCQATMAPPRETQADAR